MTTTATLVVTGRYSGWNSTSASSAAIARSTELVDVSAWLDRVPVGEPAIGLILAALDVDIDNGAAWNRWYDLEHLAPNLSLPDVVTGHRYVAPPDLHDCRIAPADDPVWGRGGASTSRVRDVGRSRCCDFGDECAS